MRSKPNPERKLTIAHLMPWTGVGGVEIATLRMTEATRDHVRNVAFCLPEAKELKAAFEQIGIETVVYEAPEPSLRHGAGYLRQSRRLARQLRAVGTDIVHFSDEKASYHNSLAALLARVRIVCHIRVTMPTLSVRSKLCLWPVESYIFVSKDSRQTFGMRVPERKVRVIYDWVRIPADDPAERREAVRQELGLPADAIVVGMVARVSAQKDYFTLAAAAEKVLAERPQTRFLVIGDNALVPLNREHYAKVAERLESLGIADKFIFTGHRTDVSRLIPAMDIGVLCSHREGFGLAIIECMAMAKPVVATSIGGPLEIVKHGVNGYLHRHEDYGELASQLLTLISAPEEIAKLGVVAREDVRLRFSEDRFTGEILQAYGDVMRGRNR